MNAITRKLRNLFYKRPSVESVQPVPPLERSEKGTRNRNPETEEYPHIVRLPITSSVEALENIKDQTVQLNVGPPKFDLGTSTVKPKPRKPRKAVSKAPVRKATKAIKPRAKVAKAAPKKISKSRVVQISEKEKSIILKDWKNGLDTHTLANQYVVSQRRIANIIKENYPAGINLRAESVRERNLSWVKMHEQGKNYKQIAGESGLNPETVRMVLQKQGVDTSGNKTVQKTQVTVQKVPRKAPQKAKKTKAKSGNEERNLLWVKLYRDGTPVRKISEQYKVHRETVRTILRQHGIRPADQMGREISKAANIRNANAKKSTAKTPKPSKKARHKAVAKSITKAVEKPVAKPVVQPKKKKLAQGISAKACKLRVEGHSWSEIAEKLGYDQSKKVANLVRGYAKLHNIKLPKMEKSVATSPERAYSQTSKDFWEIMYRGGIGITDIAKADGQAHRTTIMNHLTKVGLHKKGPYNTGLKDKKNQKK